MSETSRICLGIPDVSLIASEIGLGIPDVSLIASGIGLGIPDMSLITSGIGRYFRHFRCASGVLRLFNTILYQMETEKIKKTGRRRGRPRGRSRRRGIHRRCRPRYRYRRREFLTCASGVPNMCVGSSATSSDAILTASFDIHTTSKNV